MQGTYARGSIKESVVLKPSDTLIFGEKKNRNDASGAPVALDYFMDMLEGKGGNDFDKVEHGCHSSVSQGRSGGSNFAFIDGSARYLKYGRSVWPVNMWAIADEDRVTYAFQP
jgi:prepilin-type processing-associated H-X9-DG protein